MESVESIDFAIDLAATYKLAQGAAFRREAFGGIIYHYQGDRPDPRMIFVPSSFLIGLLERLEQAPLRELIDAARERFAMSEDQVRVVEEFFNKLHHQGAIAGALC